MIAELVPDFKHRRYEIVIHNGVTEKQLAAATQGTVGREGRFSDAYLMHQLNGVNYKTKISTLRGDYQKPDGSKAIACGCGKNMTSNHGPTTSFRSASTASSGCGRRRRAKATSTSFAPLSLKT